MPASKDCVFDPCDIPLCLRDEDLKKFVLGMLSQLILAYKYHSGCFSDLHIYCHLDVSVYRKANFFVTCKASALQKETFRTQEQSLTNI
jgi:hypothetical protein